MAKNNKIPIKSIPIDTKIHPKNNPIRVENNRTGKLIIIRKETKYVWLFVCPVISESVPYFVYVSIKAKVMRAKCPTTNIKATLFLKSFLIKDNKDFIEFFLYFFCAAIFFAPTR